MSSQYYGNSKQALRKWIYERIQTPVIERFGSIWMSAAAHKEFKENYCAGCGRAKKNARTVWGESFCGECADEMEPAYKLFRVAGKGWKCDLRKLFK